MPLGQNTIKKKLGPGQLCRHCSAQYDDPMEDGSSPIYTVEFDKKDKQGKNIPGWACKNCGFEWYVYGGKKAKIKPMKAGLELTLVMSGINPGNLADHLEAHKSSGNRIASIGGSPLPVGVDIPRDPAPTDPVVTDAANEELAAMNAENSGEEGLESVDPALEVAGENTNPDQQPQD